MKKMLIALTGAMIATGAWAQAPQGGGGRGLASADADGDGVVTRAEMTTQIEGRFARMDADKNGTVTPEEMAAARGAGGGGGGGGGGAYGGGGAGPAAAGAGGGGAAPSPMTKEQYIAQSMRRFDAADTNHDGKLDKDELAAASPPAAPRPAGG